jgi:putative phosphoesterase
LKIGLLSDTHSYIDEKVLNFFKDCDEIWHAGDIGDSSVFDTLESMFKVRAVYGNIDNHEIRTFIPEFQIFTIENYKVVMTHIGGYPNKYAPKIKDLLQVKKPNLFISGHSHILKVINDQELNLLHINPGAYGKSGFHKVRTAVRFNINNGKISDFEILEIKRL